MIRLWMLVFVQHMASRLVIDPYRILDDKAFRVQGFTYATLGAPVTG
jgi:hypothetical protein